MKPTPYACHFLFAAVFFTAGGMAALRTSLPAMIGLAGIQINAMIAAFNLLPVSVLDGRKVLAWNAGIFLVLVIAAFGTLGGSYYFL